VPWETLTHLDPRAGTLLFVVDAMKRLQPQDYA